jgi:transcriptional regulator with XRE-family HTH domain
VAKDLRMAVGRRLRELRNEQRVSQEALAHRAHLHRNYIGCVERGEKIPSIETLARVSQILGLSLAEFFAPFNQKPVKRSN